MSGCTDGFVPQSMYNTNPVITARKLKQTPVTIRVAVLVWKKHTYDTASRKVSMLKNIDQKLSPTKRIIIWRQYLQINNAIGKLTANATASMPKYELLFLARYDALQNTIRTSRVYLAWYRRTALDASSLSDTPRC